MSKIHHAATAPVTGYPLNAKWSVAVPATDDITNIVTNPSIETNTTGYTAVGGSVARVLTKQRRGAYSLEVTATAVYFGTVTTVTNRHYPWSFDFWGAPGVPFSAYWADTSGNVLGRAKTFVGKGLWERLQINYYETSGTTRRLYVAKGATSSAAPFYVDGMLVPSAVDAFDVWHYFDGDTEGGRSNVVDFYWTGTRHGSTSVMKAHTRRGGKIIPLAYYGFTVLAMLGTGLSPIENVSIPLSLSGGAQYQRTLYGTRTFDLVGTLEATGWPELQRKHRELSHALNVTRQPVTQPILLQYEPIDDRGEVIGETIEILASLDNGLEGKADNPYQENLSLRFQTYLSHMGNLDGTEGSTLNVRDELANANYIVRRDTQGTWTALETGLSAPALALLKLPNGQWLVGGAFSNAGGEANADFLALYDPATNVFSALNATPLNGSVRALALLPTGNVAVGGAFTNAGGDANADYLCELDLTTGAFAAFNAVTLNNSVNALAVLPNYTVAVGGDFTNVGGLGVNYLVKLSLDTSAYSGFTVTQLGAPVNVLAVDRGNRLWIGGSFVNVGGQANQDGLTALVGDLSGFSYDAFQVILPNSNPLSNEVLTITALENGEILVGGRFQDVNGDTSWDYLFSGILAPAGGSNEIFMPRSKIIDDISAVVTATIETTPGTILFGGFFDSAGGVALYDRVVQLVGTTFTPLDVDLPGTGEITALAGTPLGELIISYDEAGSAYTSGTTALTNSGTADAFPVIVIEYSSSATVIAPLHSIRNLSTGQVLSFNLSLVPGEKLSIDLRRGRKTITSDLRGDLSGTILPGSNWDSFRLIPGENALNVFIDVAAASNASAYAYWTPAYAELEDAIR